MKIITKLATMFSVMAIYGNAATVIPKANSAVNVPRKGALSEAERRATWERNFMKRYGGLCEKPGSQQGKVVFINGQLKLDEEFIRNQIAAIEDFTRIRIGYAKVINVTISTASEILRKYGAQMAIYIVDDTGLPSLLTAPEAKWAFVNIAALSKDGVDVEKVKTRLRKELWRAFAYTAGCGDSTDARSVVQPVATLSDLDSIVVENFDPIQMQGLLKNLRKICVTPKHVAPYKTACLRGWAPAPTNEYQRAIWDKIQADKERGPANPITIPPPKK